jgi:nicotinate-nucleotide--dimethylbenzimidazole phosphoribosyltransferase
MLSTSQTSQLEQSAFESALQNALDSKTKPIGSLGRIEALAAQIARTQRSLKPRAKTCSLTIFAADHGLASSGVSAFPQDVTRAMVHNFLAGGAAATVFARSLDAVVRVVDAGVAGERLRHRDLLDRYIAAGTKNAIEQAAMTEAECEKALEAGFLIGRQIESDVACFGEMGIGNTSAASLVSAKILGHEIADLVGRGTGLDQDGLSRKKVLLEKAAARTPSKLAPKMALAEYGGFEIVMMAGAMIGAARRRRIVIVDGFIATTAALSARALAPGCETAFIYAHASAEAGHRLLLEALNAKPLLEFDMRLGEGTGAILAWPLVKAAAAMLSDMATFESAQVSGQIEDQPA